MEQQWWAQVYSSEGHFRLRPNWGAIIIFTETEVQVQISLARKRREQRPREDELNVQGTRVSGHECSPQNLQPAFETPVFRGDGRIVLLLCWKVFSGSPIVAESGHSPPSGRPEQHSGGDLLQFHVLISLVLSTGSCPLRPHHFSNLVPYQRCSTLQLLLDFRSHPREKALPEAPRLASFLSVVPSAGSSAL